MGMRAAEARTRILPFFALSLRELTPAMGMKLYQTIRWPKVSDVDGAVLVDDLTQISPTLMTLFDGSPLI